MLNLLQFRNYAFLSQAAYRDLSGMPVNAAPEVLEQALKNADSTIGIKNIFTNIQAQYLTGSATATDLTDGFSFIDHHPNDWVGFSATVFQSNADGSYTVAVRGTEPSGLQIPLDLLSADGLGVVLAGKAREQEIAAYRYYKQLTTVPGQAVVYSVQEKLMLAGLYAGSFNPLMTAAGYVAITALVMGDLGLGSGPTPLIPAGAKINFTGHSLGGHVATLLAQLVAINNGAGTVGDVVTYNAPGQGSIAGNIANWLGIPLADQTIANQITNIIGEGGMNAASWIGSRPGEIQNVFIEKETNPLNNHSIVKLSDSRALYDTFAKLSPALDQSTTKQILEGASNIGLNSLEVGLDALRAIFLGESALQAGKTTQEDRAQFYTNLYALQDNAGFKSLSGSAAVRSLIGAGASSLVSQAKSDFGYYFALRTLSPFALISAASTFISTQNALYTQWQADQSLSTAERAQGKANLTDEYLQDRAAMLTWKLKLATEDKTASHAFPYAYNQRAFFDDRASGQQIYLSDAALPTQRPYYLFGSDAAETDLDGGSLGDRIYGGAGNDYLYGYAGNDYLEGDAGNDQLIGGTGNDTLVGGAGTDTYQFTAGDGIDTLEDTGGQGSIKVGLDTLNGGKETAPGAGLWQSVDGKYRYALVNEADGSQTLVILTAQAEDRILVKRFQPGWLGISLDSVPNPTYAPLTPTNLLVLADTNPADDPVGVDRSVSAGSWDILGTANNDQITGNSLADRINGGAGKDTLNGDWGDDELIGGAGADRLYGGFGNDRLYALSAMSFDAALAAKDTPVATPAEVDLLEGGPGNDLLIGAAGNWLMGGGGADILLGGGADDLAQGDTVGAGSEGGISLGAIGLADGNRVVLDYNPVKHKYSYYVTHTEGGLTRAAARIGYEATDGDADTILTGAGNDIVLGEAGDDTLALGAGADMGFGGAGSDTIDGGDGDDLLFGDFNHDAGTPSGVESALEMLNFEGLHGLYHGNDVLNGGAGNDKIWGNGGSDTIDGGDGNDELHGDDDLTPGQYQKADLLIGGTGDDQIWGDGGDDEILGGDGADIILGDNGELDAQFHGNDRVFGGEGADTIWGNGGNDELYGEAGDDYIDGDNLELAGDKHGKDVLYGGAGNDTLIGNGNDDILYGGDGNDSLMGDTPGAELDAAYQGADFLDGGAGDDSLIGGGKADQLFGGDGNDVLRGDAAGLTAEVQGNDWLDGGNGDDTLMGDGGDDSLIGGAGADDLWGGMGSDRLTGGTGVDNLMGETGSDTYVFSLGDSAVEGGLADTIVDLSGVNTIEFGDGITRESISLSRNPTDFDLVLAYSATDRIIVRGGFRGAVQTLRFSDGSTASLAQLIGEQITDPLVISLIDPGAAAYGGTSADRISATGGGSTLSGGRGADTLTATGGDNTYLYSLGDGQDTLQDTSAKLDDDGKPQPNTLKFGAGIAPEDLQLVFQPRTYFNNEEQYVIRFRNAPTDEIHVSPFSSYSTEEAPGIDRFEFESGQVLTWAELLLRGFDIETRSDLPSWYTQYGTSVNDRFVMGDGNDDVRGYAGDDTIVGQGGNDGLDGGEGNDTILGGAGNDSINGGEGDDVLDGGVGDDILDSGSGNDSISGGAGADMLKGGDGNDVYAFNLGDGDDIVLDDSGRNLVRFGNGLSGDAMTVSQSVADDGRRYVDLDFGGGDRLSLCNADLGSISELHFADGTVLSQADLMARLPGVISQGSEGDDRLYGSDGADILLGRAGNDSLYGLGGADDLDGGFGNDRIEGGAGVDTYHVRLGMGWDSFIEAAGETNLLQLDKGVSAGALSQSRHGDDLLLSFIDGSSGVRLVYYYGLGQSWQVRDGATGSTRSLEDFLGEVVVGHPLETPNQLWENYKQQIEGNFIDLLTRKGYAQGADGKLQRYMTEVFPTLTRITHDVADLSFTTAPSEANGFGDSVSSQQTDFAQTIEIGVKRLFTADRLSVASLTGANAPVFIPAGVGFIPNGKTGVWDLGSEYQLLRVYKPGQPVGTWIFSPGYFLPSTNTENFVVQRQQIGIARHVTIYELHGGSGNDLLFGHGYGLVDAGDGDDVVRMNTSTYLTPAEYELFGDSARLGALLYGGAGNDRLYGGASADTLAGGSGEDILDGRRGGDTYVILPGSGMDIVADTLGIGWTESSDDLYTSHRPILIEDRAVDTVVLPDVVRPEDLRFAWGETMLSAPYFEDINHHVRWIPTAVAQTVFVTLDVSWGGEDAVRIVMPHSDDLVGSGIEQLRLADGTTLSMGELIALAPPAPSFDPHEGDNSLTGVGDESTPLCGAGGNDIIRGSGWLDGGTGNDHLEGEAGDDYLIGGRGANELLGGAGNDVLGFTGADYWSLGNLYVGGQGDDVIFGSQASDTYLFERGDGRDRIGDFYHDVEGRVGDANIYRDVDLVARSPYRDYEYVAQDLSYLEWLGVPAEMTNGTRGEPIYIAGDTLRFGAGIRPDDIGVTREDDDLCLSLKDSTDQVRFARWFQHAAKPLALVEFDAGATWDGATLESRIGATSNSAPVVAHPLLDQIAMEDQAYSWAVPDDTFTDADVGDTLTYSVTLANGSPLPSWLSYNATTRTLSGTPTNGDVGSLSLKVTATDIASAAASGIFALDVANTNDAPMLAHAIADQTATEDAAFSYTIPVDAFGDVDVGDLLSYGVTLANGSPLPSWLSYNATTRTLSGTPTNGDVGSLNLKVTATDIAGATASGIFALDVANTNDAPVLAHAIADQSATEDAAFSYTIPVDAFTDVDVGDVLSYGVTLANGSPLPSWLSYNATTRTLSGTPTSTSAGLLSLRTTATDLAGASASSTFTLDIANHIVGTAAANTLTGTALRDVIEGLAGNDTLNGGLGADTFIGGTGNDTYYVDNIGDVVTEQAGEGTDKVISSISYILSDNVENLTLTGSAALNGTGNALDNVLVANAAGNRLDGGAGNDTLTGGIGNDVLIGGDGNDVLNGGAGVDTLTGGTGNDTYYVDNAGDVVTEQVGEGTDKVISSISYVLGDNVENLTLTGSAAINGTGNALDNVLVANAAGNRLDGGAGNDTLTGGIGNDVLIGGDGNDVLNGGAGADAMTGGTGNDTYYVDNAADIVTELSGEGADKVISSISYILSDNVENLSLTGSAAINGTGNALNNVIVGNGAPNILDGAAGDDTLNGGIANDTLIGGAGNDVLNGAAGADAMTGGTGNDTYYVAAAGDVVTELSGEGTDKVLASISYVLTDNVESLTLTGTVAINGAGNALANTLVGNAENNLLNGGDGADTLNGAAGLDFLEGMAGNDVLSDTSGSGYFNGGIGNDTLTGGIGNDLFIGGSGNDVINTGTGADVIAFNKGDGQDTFNASIGADNTLSLGGAIAYSDLTFQKSGNNLILNVGVGDRITLANWYANASNHSVLNLQIISEAMTAFDAASSDSLLNKKVQDFDFQGLVNNFDAARVANPGLSTWALTNGLTSFHLSSSDTDALGGDLAYQYGKAGTLAGIGLTSAQEVLAAPNFGAAPQTLRPMSGLHEGMVTLS